MARRPTTVPLLAALACLLALALTGLLALGSASVREHDAAMLYGLAALDGRGLHPLSVALVSLVGPLPYALAGLGLAWWAVAQQRRPRAAAVAALLVLTGASTQLLKHAVARPRVVAWLGEDQLGALAWPSGHATAAMTLALGAVLVAPPALRIATALGGAAFAAAVGYALIVLAWHFPSDVLGGFLMAGLWTALALAALRALEGRPRATRPGQRLGPRLTAALVAGAAVAGAAAIVAGHRTVALYASERPTVVAGTLAIAAVAAGLAGALARAA